MHLLLKTWPSTLRAGTPLQPSHPHHLLCKKPPAHSRGISLDSSDLEETQFSSFATNLNAGTETAAGAAGQERPEPGYKPNSDRGGAPEGAPAADATGMSPSG